MTSSIQPSPRETARWYFDLISPFAYFQSLALPTLRERIDIEPVPVLFAGLLKHHGQLGPAEIAGKRRYTYRYVTWLAQREGIKFRAPARHPFNPLPALRLLVALERIDAVHAAFDFVWGEGGDISAPEGWAALCSRLGVDDPQRLIDDPKVKQRLTDNTHSAIEAGAFGVPTLELRGELFWGYEATPMLLDFLNDPALFQSPVMHRVDTLPIGIERKKS